MELEVIKSPITASAEGLDNSTCNCEPNSGCIESSTNECGQSVADCIHENRSVEVFLRLMGIIWKTDGKSASEDVLQYMWNFCIRGGLTALMIYSFLTLLFVLVKFDQYSATLDSYAVLLSVTVLLQCITLFFAMQNIHSRMMKGAIKGFTIHMNDGLNPSYRVLLISFIIGIIPVYYLFIHPFVFLYIYLVGQLAACCILSATTYFICTDCIVAVSLLDELIALEKKQELTYEQYSAVCSVVEKSQEQSRWINNSIVVVAFLDIATVLVFLFDIVDHVPFFTVLEILSMLLKEMPFLMVVYWQVAQVNEKYSKFMKSLGGALWNAQPDADNRRMAIYIKAQSNPIVMSLAGMKLKRKDLAWQFALWCFAFVVSIAKAAVINEI